MIRYLVFALLVLFSISEPAHAELAPASFRTLVHSDSIVCARVERIHRDKGHWIKWRNGKKEYFQTKLMAEAVVLRVCKGSKLSVGQRVFIAAYPRMAGCGITHVSAGEEALFFLNAEDKRSGVDLERNVYGAEIDKILAGRPLYSIAHSGVGKVPISMKARQMGVAVQRTKRWGIHLEAPLGVPPGLPISWEPQAQIGQDGRYYRRGQIPMEAMEKLLNRLMAEQKIPRRLLTRKKAPSFADSKGPIVLKA